MWFKIFRVISKKTMESDMLKQVINKCIWNVNFWNTQDNAHEGKKRKREEQTQKNNIIQ